MNVCDGAEVKAFIKSVVRDYQKIDGLVNNAGIRMDRTLLYMEEREWEEVLGVNLTGVFHVTKAVIPHMLKARRGRIVNIGSVSGIQGLSGQTNYSAAKAGLHGFTKALAKETASYGIAVNAVAARAGGNGDAAGPVRGVSGTAAVRCADKAVVPAGGGGHACPFSAG